MTFWYGARESFDKLSQTDVMSWDNYIEWSKLNQLKELVSLDGILNGDLVNPDFDNADDWNFILIDEQFQTGFYNSVEYVLKNIETKKKFNLLAVIKEPNEKCELLELADFEFVGYELLDKDYSNSALTNCGGFDETFLPNELNEYGLINDYEKAYDIRKRLVENNPEEHHANCNVFAVWRHKTIGRAK
ncbi:MAG: hypothetical protein M3033_08855 [Acidobacteriota bacterium]|nr:hypothetical protein [Acidobacteriota bacterium]